MAWLFYSGTSQRLIALASGDWPSNPASEAMIGSTVRSNFQGGFKTRSPQPFSPGEPGLTVSSKTSAGGSFRRADFLEEGLGPGPLRQGIP